MQYVFVESRGFDDPGGDQAVNTRGFSFVVVDCKTGKRHGCPIKIDAEWK